MQQQDLSPEMEKILNEALDMSNTEIGQRDINELIKQYLTRKAGDLVLDLEIDDIPKVLNMEYLAKRFFEKPASWLTEKINNETADSKVQGLSDVERARLKDALDTLAWELQELSDNL